MTFTKTRQKAKGHSRCVECGQEYDHTWTEPVACPGGSLVFGFARCGCGSVSAAIEATPPDLPEGFLGYLLQVFLLGALTTLERTDHERPKHHH